MLRPSMFSDSLFDDFMNGFMFSGFPDADKILYGKHVKNMMKTDVRETESGYEVDIDLPGFRKDEIRLQLTRGYLTVNAVKGLDKSEEDKKEKYVRRERYAGNMSRSFYVGEHVAEKDIHPRYEDGILKFVIPKEEKKAVEDRKHYISIEG